MDKGSWYTVVSALFWMGLLAASPQVEAARKAWAALDPDTQKLTIETGEPDEADFSADSPQIPVAWASFQDDIQDSGWAYLQIESNEQVEDEVQAYAAGALEANLTRQLMEYQWTNLFAFYCDNQTDYCRRLEEFMDKHLIYSQLKQHRFKHEDSFWHLAHLQHKQLVGVSDAFENHTLDFSRELNGSTRAVANTQMMVVDYKLFTPGSPLPDGTFWLYEQMTGMTRHADKSRELANATYWPSYNVAYFDDIYRATGQPPKLEKYGDFYSYENCPRARMFRRDQAKLTDMDSIVKYMNYNDYKNDPLSRCNCTPPYNPLFAISARYDLLSPTGEYGLPEMYPRGVGGIDVKATNHELFKSLEFIGVNGPTSITQPPFQWSTSGLLDSHVGHPDKWDFGPVHHKWEPARRDQQEPAPAA
ncbi:putative phospholipase B-like 2 [Amblyomma americanum]